MSHWLVATEAAEAGSVDSEAWVAGSAETADSAEKGSAVVAAAGSVVSVAGSVESAGSEALEEEAGSVRSTGSTCCGSIHTPLTTRRFPEPYSKSQAPSFETGWFP
jgi:hypothetical protein